MAHRALARPHRHGRVALGQLERGEALGRPTGATSLVVTSSQKQTNCLPLGALGLARAPRRRRRPRSPGDAHAVGHAVGHVDAPVAVVAHACRRPGAGGPDWATVPPLMTTGRPAACAARSRARPRRRDVLRPRASTGAKPVRCSIPHIARRSSASPSRGRRRPPPPRRPSARSQAASMPRSSAVTTTRPLAGHDPELVARSRRARRPSITPGRSLPPNTSGCSIDARRHHDLGGAERGTWCRPGRPARGCPRRRRRRRPGCRISTPAARRLRRRGRPRASRRRRCPSIGEPPAQRQALVDQRRVAALARPRRWPPRGPTRRRRSRARRRGGAPSRSARCAGGARIELARARRRCAGTSRSTSSAQRGRMNVL